MTYIENLGANAKAASHIVASASTKLKNDALSAIAAALVANTDTIIKQNKIDLENAEKNGMSASMLDRLMLDEKRIRGIADGVLTLVDAEDLIGSIDSGVVRPNGLKICKTRVPLGVIGIIFESRPNVTVDAATLCLKAGNTVILKGGKEAINSNKCLADIMRNAIESVGLPKDAVALVEDTSRESTNQLMKLNKYLDVLIPRGGAGLINAVVTQATVPVIETGTGNCHVYVDQFADQEMAVNIIKNAKTQRIGVCNACESIVVHRAIAKEFLPKLYAALKEYDVEMRGDSYAVECLGPDQPLVKDATEEDWGTEYLDYIMSVKIVDSLDEAIAHINKYNTSHSEAIITKNYDVAQRFLNEIDSACVYVNASTRFSDGNEFGLGAEIGISTQKLHARGPMGLEALTSYKYIIYGNGQVRP